MQLGLFGWVLAFSAGAETPGAQACIVGGRPFIRERCSMSSRLSFLSCTGMHSLHTYMCTHIIDACSAHLGDTLLNL